MIHLALKQVNLPVRSRFCYRPLRHQVQTHEMMLLHCHGRNLLKKLHFPKQVVYVELLHAFHPAFVVLSHFLPLQIDSELYENVEDAVPQVSNKVEALGSI